MPRDKDLKRLVRARMQKTGEAYTAARAQVLRKRTAKTARPRSAAPVPRLTPPSAPAPIDYASLSGMMKDEIILEKTGRTWEQWTKTLDAHRAHEMAHRDIAMLVSKEYGVANWWTQSVTVGYERIKGLRARGQRRDGTFEANKSRTFNVPVEQLFDACADAGVRRRWLTGVTGVKVRTATSPKSIRLGWPDGSIVILLFGPKGASKSMVAVQHTKLPDKDTADRLKKFWAKSFDALAKALG
jgi:uncharacterized protein YndB with AHSA1/START domain